MAWKIYSVIFAVVVLSAPAVFIGTEAFWRAAFLILVAWEVMYNFFISRVLGLGQRGIEGGLAAWLFGLAVFIAAYVGLFLYAYRRHDVWHVARGED